MRFELKHWIILGFGVALLAGGSILLKETGLPILFETYESTQNPKCFVELSCRDYQIKADLYQNDVFKTTIFSKIHFESKEVFAVGNAVNYTIDSTISDPKYAKKLYFAIATEKDDFTNIEKVPVDTVLTDLKNKDRLIDMQAISDNVYHREGFWFHDRPASVNLVIISIDENGTAAYSIRDPNESLFRIEPFENKLKADENRTANISNAQVLALTWIGVAMAPMLLGSDFIVRVFLRD